MLLKIASIGAATIILVGSKTCSEPAPQPEPTQRPAVQQTIQATSPYLEVPTSGLLPYAADDPRAILAAKLAVAIAANERGDFAEATAALEPSALTAGEFARDLVLQQRAISEAGRLNYTDAIATLGQIDKDSTLWGEALLKRANWSLELDDGDAALQLLGTTVLPEDQAGRLSATQTIESELLRSRALRARNQAGDLQLAYLACKRVWLASGRDSELANEATACMSGLEGSAEDGTLLSSKEAVQRAQVLGKSHANKEVIALLQPEKEFLRADLKAGGWAGCYGTYELGRAHHKQRDYKKSIPLLASIPGSCKEEDVQVRSRYLKAQGEGRAGRGEDSIASFVELSELHPLHSYADDGLYNAGKQAQKDGNSERARVLFTRMATTFPDGDMVGKGLWGMAWAHLRQGQRDEALSWLEQLAAGNPRGRQREYVLMARYWGARARLDLDRSDTTAAATLRALAASEPMHYYGVLALWKLHSLDPDAAKQVTAALNSQAEELRSSSREPKSFFPERSFAEHQLMVRAVSLLRAGFKEAAAALIDQALDLERDAPWETSTLLYASHLLELADNPYRSHNLLRKAFNKKHPEASADNLTMIRHAFPLAFHEEILRVTKEYEWSPLLFQGLVREESAFMPAVISWAGAMGLSQLMWPTAKETARKMGIKGLTRARLNDPELNLSIGTTYFQGLHRRWKGHLPLAIGSYNAGPGAVNRWIKSDGNMELDMWVEAIPFDQTRHYVKRVLSSFQTYQFLYGAGAATIPLRIGPVRDAINSGDPSGS